MPLPDREVSRILVVGAHPDDNDFGAAIGVRNPGHLPRCTYGDAGGFDRTPREQVPALRAAEQRAAAAACGVTDVRFLHGYHDGYLEPKTSLQRDIVRVIRQVHPDRVVAQSPVRSGSASTPATPIIWPPARRPHER